MRKEQKNFNQTGTLYREAYFPTFVFSRDLPDATLFNDKLKKKIYSWKRKDERGVKSQHFNSTLLSNAALSFLISDMNSGVAHTICLYKQLFTIVSREIYNVVSRP